MSDLSLESTALVLIDHQKMFFSLLEKTEKERVEFYLAILIKAAAALKLPIIITSNMEKERSSPLIKTISENAPEAFENRIMRTGVINAFGSEEFASAVKQTSCNSLIIAGFPCDVSLASAAISAANLRYNVHAVIDASGSPTALAQDLAIRRMENAGVSPTTAIAVMSELAKDASTPQGQALMNVFFGEVIFGKDRSFKA